MRNTFFSRHCSWAAEWPWKAAPRQSGADIVSNWCLLQAKGNLAQALAQAQRYSAALQKVPGVERAWAHEPGVVYVVLEGTALLELALDDYAMPWKAAVPERWLLDYGVAIPFEELNLTHARHGILGDTLARTLMHAGHRVVRERLLLDEGKAAFDLARAVQLHMKALEENVPVDYTAIAGPLTTEPERQPHPVPGGNLMKALADKALRMGVQTTDVVGIGHFALSTIQALQEESFSNLRVDFDSALLTSQLRDGVADVLDGWRNRSHTDVRDTAVIFHGPAFGGNREIAAVKSNSDITYFTERVAHHTHQLRQAFGHIVSLRDANHDDLARNTSLGLEALRLEHKKLLHFFVKPAQDFPARGMRHKRHATLDEVRSQLGVNGLRLGLLSANPTHVLRLDTARWVENILHLGRSMHDAFIKAHAAVQDHCKGVATMQAGPIPHAAKPLVMALLRWPDCHQEAISTLNPTRIYRHAVELVQLIHKIHANVPMQELDGAGLEAMGTAWSLAAAQLRTLLDVMGIDVLEWEANAASRAPSER